MADMKHNPFSRPIPGQSLTQPKGGAPYERPPQFTDIEEASESMFVTLTQPRNAMLITKTLERGASAESIARTIAFQGAMSGLWSPDLMVQMARDRLLFTIAAIGEKNKVKNLKYTDPDDELIEQLVQLKADTPEEEEAVAPEEEVVAEEEVPAPAPVGGLFAQAAEGGE